MATTIYANKSQLETTSELKDIIISAWQTIPKETINKLINSSQNIKLNVINIIGEFTNYSTLCSLSYFVLTNHHYQN